MKWFVAALAALAIAVPTKALACDEHEKTAAAKPTIQKLSVTELASLKKENKATVYDANSPETRQKAGIIPGAKLLTSVAKFEPAKELPANKSDKIVFYCANEMCGASHQAAKKANQAGWTDVAVLPVGIEGWKAAGQPTAAPSQS